MSYLGDTNIGVSQTDLIRRAFGASIPMAPPRVAAPPARPPVYGPTTPTTFPTGTSTPRPPIPASKPTATVTAPPVLKPSISVAPTTGGGGVVISPAGFTPVVPVEGSTDAGVPSWVWIVGAGAAVYLATRSRSRRTR